MTPHEELPFVAAVEANPNDNVTRLAFADWLEERGDPRGVWLRDPELAPWMMPGVVNPFPRLVDALPNPNAERLIFTHRNEAIPAILEGLYRRAPTDPSLSAINRTNEAIIRSMPEISNRRRWPKNLCELGDKTGPIVARFYWHLIAQTLYDFYYDNSLYLTQQIIKLQSSLAEISILLVWKGIETSTFRFAREKSLLIESSVRFGPSSRLVEHVLRATLDKSGDIREVALNTIQQIFQVGMEEALAGLSIYNGQSRELHQILRRSPQLVHELFSFARDTAKPVEQRLFILDALVPSPDVPDDWNWLIAPIIDLLDDPEPAVVSQAILVLQNFGSRAALTAPRLLEMLRSGQEGVICPILTALPQIDLGATTQAVPQVTAWTNHSDPAIRRFARRFVAHHTQPSEFADLARQQFTHPDPERRAEAIRWLQSCSELSADTRQLVQEALTDEALVVRLAAKDVLDQHRILKSRKLGDSVLPEGY